MDWKNLHGYIEVSPFMLFESTADSEQHSYDDNLQLTTTYDEVDDAQSCCSDSSETGNASDNAQFQECSYSNKTDRKRAHCLDNYNEAEDDDGATSDQECSSRNVGFVFSTTQKKCKVFAESKMESMKKEEKDKLFWDACLAS